jgi:hypothetical protein
MGNVKFLNSGSFLHQAHQTGLPDRLEPVIDLEFVKARG